MRARMGIRGKGIILLRMRMRGRGRVSSREGNRHIGR